MSAINVILSRHALFTKRLNSNKSIASWLERCSVVLATKNISIQLSLYRTAFAIADNNPCKRALFGSAFFEAEIIKGVRNIGGSVIPGCL